MSIFQMSLTAGVLIIAIVIIRSLALNKLPKSFFLALWGVAACRLLIAFRIPSSFSIFNAFNKAITVLEPIAETPTIQGVSNYNFINTMPQAIPSLEKAISISPLEIICLIGVVSIGILFAIAYTKNYTELKTALPIKNNPMLEQWQSKQKLLRKFKILTSDKITTPIAFGIIKPKIILPKTMNLNDEQLVQYVLAHELQHIKHFDMFWKIILMVVVCLHWFNPLVWAMYVLANRDLELSCDEKVVRQFGEVAKSAYALSLISMAEQRSKFTPLYNGFSKNAAEERIVSIMKYKKISVIALVLSFILIAGITTAFGTSAASERNNDSVLPAEDPNIQEGFDLYDLSDTLKLYGKYGLSFDKNAEMIYFNNTPVREIWNPTSGVLVTLHGGIGFPDNAVDLTPIYENGEIIGLSQISQAEYDKRTEERRKAVQFITRPIGVANENYTQEEYDLIMSLKIDGYETMTVADFNGKVMNKTEESHEAYQNAMEHVMAGLSISDPNAPFILNTLRASVEENGSEHLKAFDSYRDPSFYGESYVKIGEADNFIDYSVDYNILDKTKLTVAERDKFMQDFMISMQAFVDSKSQEELMNKNDIQIAFTDELNRIAKQLSNDLIQVSSVELLGIS